ncbi:MAG: SHOCT domain-containing protein [Candidatus Dormibacteraeota bacterium]|nr:SHOCT domain-containing protein [Candidatus Dormibacteraeota bacterium]
MMMGAGWAGPWLVMMVIPLLMVLGVLGFVAWSLGGGRSHWGGRDRPARLGDRREDPLAILQERYASGAIGREEFERRLDVLLGTEPGGVADSL